MKESKSRYADTGITTSELGTHFVVHCPKCSGKSLVNTWEEGHKLVCTACFHVEMPGHWYGEMRAFVAVKCRECHAPLHRDAKTDGIWKKLAVHCDQCGDDCEYEAHISKYPRNNGQVTDPVYGLPLWLQKEFRSDVFWCYNYEQLEVLYGYIGAKLRERGISPRNLVSKNRSMVNRLPSFLKDAGNRAPLLKLMDGLRLK